LIFLRAACDRDELLDRIDRPFEVHGSATYRSETRAQTRSEEDLAFGAAPALLGVTALQGGVIASMAAVVHPLVLPLLLRSVQPAVSNVIVNVEVAPRLPRGQRATFLSLYSLAGRLGYGAVLLALAALAGDGEAADPDAITGLLRRCAAGAAVAIVALALTRRALGGAGSGRSARLFD